MTKAKTPAKHLGSTPWFPKHDKDFLLGQRVIYAGHQIVTCITPARDYRVSAPNKDGRQWVRTVEGTDIYADVINLNFLPGGQL
jgi:hypothetical protein